MKLIFKCQMYKLTRQVFYFAIISTFLIFQSCSSEESSNSISNTPIVEGFEYLDAATSGIDFINELDPETNKTPIDYINIYNGGGVATGDINNDGLVDVFFTGNLSDNKLYLNEGNLSFKDISETSNIGSSDSWCTGTTMVDINNDGLLDIYVNRSYSLENPDNRRNQLYINNGDLSFTESAAKYGIDDNGCSIQSVFFDMDNDGDLDLFVGNHPPSLLIKPGASSHYERWLEKKHEVSCHLYKNNGNGKFTDVTEAANVLGYGWTLSVTAGDLNMDGFTDIYITTDHSEPDVYYVNQGDGTFKNELEETFKHISFSCMGADITDFNNDGLSDVITLDMLSENNFREKAQMSSMNIDAFWGLVKQGYHQQIMRNMMHINTGKGTFQEVGQLAEVHRTDWSWAVLGADFNNDSHNDIYVSNGYLIDIMDRDLRINKNKMYAEAADDPDFEEKVKSINREFLKRCTSTPLKNVFYKNNGELNFKNESEAYNLDFSGFSSGASYADLDNDGDLDLVVSNLNAKASVHINQASKGKNQHYLRIKLDNLGKTAYGTKVIVHLDNGKNIQDFNPTRGYQSSVEPVLHFGLGSQDKVELVEVIWPGNFLQTINNPGIDQVLTIKRDANINQKYTLESNDLLANVAEDLNLNIKHQENDFDDFQKQILVPHKMSQFGPAVAVGDMNGDKLEDIYIGSSTGGTRKLMFQNSDGSFTDAKSPVLASHSVFEDIDAQIVDVDNDGDNDLYVVSGGNEYEKNSNQYGDRLYINDGAGNLSHTFKSMDPKTRISGSCVEPYDFNGDGLLDFFVGSRHTPWNYPIASKSLLLINEKGNYIDKSDELIPSIKELGMVTDAVWVDINKDDKKDLVVVGEWMKVKLFINNGEQLIDKSEEYGLGETMGWWFSVDAHDIDQDGYEDLIVGNLGDNYKYKATDEREFHLYAKDFDASGSVDIVLAHNNDDKVVPVRGRECSSQQCPDIKKKFPSYNDFARADVTQIYSGIQEADHKQINTFKSSAFFNKGGSQFEWKPFPNEVQVSPIFDIAIMDIDQDNKAEIIMGGNLFVSEIETGRADAGVGIIMKYEDDKFKVLRPLDTGFFIDKDVRKVKIIENPQGKEMIVVANNNDYVQVWKPTS